MSQTFTFSDEVQQFILDLHNDFRNRLAEGKIAGQPGAQNMQEMEWDQDLADTAKAYSEKCTFIHSYNDQGENLAVATLRTSINDTEELKQNIKDSFDRWGMEADNFAYPTKCKRSKCGHYTQVRTKVAVQLYHRSLYEAAQLCITVVVKECTIVHNSMFSLL